MRCLWLLALGLLLAGCASTPSQTGKQQKLEQDPEFTLAQAGPDRRYRVHIAPRLAGKSPRPLVLMLHGAMGNGALFAQRTGFNQIADREGLILAYPNGTGWSSERLLTWNAGYCCAYARDHAIDDAGFIGKLITHLQQRYPVDPDRIYIAGFSNGAMLALRLASELGDRIAAVAAVSGTIGGRPSAGAPFIGLPPSMATPAVLLIHGMQDEQVPYSGGRGKKTIGTRVDASVDQALAFWSRQNHCSEPPERQRLVSGEVERWSFDCQGGALELYRLPHGGHAWPGGEAVSGWSMEALAIRVLLDNPSRALDASEVIWGFFRDHPRVRQRVPRTRFYSQAVD